MRGLETMPIRFMVISIILLIVVGIGFWQVTAFMSFSMDRSFKQDIVDLAQKVDYLRAGSDLGSMLSGEIGVPGGYEFLVDIDEDCFIGNFSGALFEANLTANITKVRKEADDVYETGIVVFEGGSKYGLGLYYGKLGSVKKLMIVIE